MTNNIFDICTFCEHYPASSGDGKPCTMCPAIGRKIATRYDRVRSMNRKEMVELFYDIQIDGVKRVLKRI